MWVVMPFGLRNCPAVFIAMMHDLKELWTSECEKAWIIPSHAEGTTIIMDDTLLYAVSIDHAFIILRCVCLIARKYHPMVPRLSRVCRRRHEKKRGQRARPIKACLAPQLEISKHSQSVSFCRRICHILLKMDALV
jgi:hypothetical protein